MAKARFDFEARHDFASADKIRTAVFDLDISPEQNLSAIKAMMSAANLATDGSLPREQRDFDAAVQTWRTVHRLADTEQKRIVVRTMMQRANDFCETDIDAAIMVWRTVHELRDDKEVVCRTMMGRANLFARNASPHDKTKAVSVVKIWQAVYGLESADQKRRLISTIMDIASKNRTFARQAAEAWAKGHADPQFTTRAVAGLYYYAGDLVAAIAYIDASGRTEPDLLVQKADILRKLGRHLEAIALATKIITQYINYRSRTLEQSAGLVNAFCCRGFSYLELGKRSTDDPRPLFDFSIGNFRSSIMLAERDNYPVPPRAYNGLGYVYESTGQTDLAKKAFAQALAIDPDNVKAGQRTG